MEQGDAGSIAAGDLAVLVEASPFTRRLPLRLDPGLPAADRATLEAALSSGSDVATAVSLTDAGGGFSLEPAPGGGLQLRGPEGTVRARFSGDSAARDALENLGLHTRQRALLDLEGETGQDFTNDESLQVWISRHPSQLFSCASSAWTQACPGEHQPIPLCARWELHVRNTSSKTLLVGGAILWNDGQMLALPEAGREIRLAPGQQDTLYNYELVSTPPLDAVEHVVVAGTGEQNRIPWQALADSGASRGISAQTRPTNTWTTSHMSFSAAANPALAAPPERLWRGGAGADVGAEGACEAAGAPPALPADAAAGLYLEPYLPATPGAPLEVALRAALAASPTGDSAAALGAALGAAGLSWPADAATRSDPPEGFSDCAGLPPAVGDAWLDGAGGAALVVDPAAGVAWRDGALVRASPGAACWRPLAFEAPGGRGGEREVPPCWERADACCARDDPEDWVPASKL